MPGWLHPLQSEHYEETVHCMLTVAESIPHHLKMTSHTSKEHLHNFLHYSLHTEECCAQGIIILYSSSDLRPQAAGHTRRNILIVSTCSRSYIYSSKNTHTYFGKEMGWHT